MMPRRASTLVSIEKIIAGLLGICTVLGAAVIGLVLYVHASDKSDIDELKKLSRETTKEIADTRVDLVKAIGAVKEQAIATNSRLDQLIADGRQRR
ncbi:Mn2+/Fe2+ NRAMP family transporter [Bradyrhizobium japonicum]